jgi:hypothetical protein
MPKLLKTCLLSILALLLFVAASDTVPNKSIWSKMPYDIEIGKTHVLDIKKHGYCSSVFDRSDSTSTCEVFKIRNRCVIFLTPEGYVDEMRFIGFCQKVGGPEWKPMKLKFATSWKKGTSQEDFIDLLYEQGIKKIKLREGTNQQYVFFKIGKLHYKAYFHEPGDRGSISCDGNPSEIIKPGLYMIFVNDDRYTSYKKMSAYR